MKTLRGKNVKKVVKKASVKPQKKNLLDSGGGESNYTASVKVLGKTYTSIAPSVKMAVEALQVGRAKGTSVLTISHGGSSRSKILTPMQTFRLFSPSKLMREVALKNISLMFDGI